MRDYLGSPSIESVKDRSGSYTRSRTTDSSCTSSKRVCCFDQSGVFSKAFRAPEAAGKVAAAMSVIDH